MNNEYYNSIVMIEKIHRLFLDVIKYELNKINIRDINNVQAVILINIGHKKLCVGELTSHGYYLGSNVTYNLRKLVENGYVFQCPSVHDKRITQVNLSEKGLELYQSLEKILENHKNNLKENNVSEVMISSLVNILLSMEKYFNKIEHRFL